jgi:hypothetical protein
VMNAVGLLAGGPIFGAIADGTGLATVFDLAAVILLCAVRFAPRTHCAAAAEPA